MTVEAILIHDYAYCGTKISNRDVYETVGSWTEDDLAALIEDPTEYLIEADRNSPDFPNLRKMYSDLSEETTCAICNVLECQGAGFPGETAADAYRVFVRTPNS